MKELLAGGRSTFAAEISDVETSTGFYNGTLTLWVGGFALKIDEALASLRSSFAAILDHQGEQTASAGASEPEEAVVARLTRLAKDAGRSDEEDRFLVAHTAIPLFENTVNVSGFLVVAGHDERLTLVSSGTSDIVASARLPAGTFRRVVSALVYWIDGFLACARLGSRR